MTLWTLIMTDAWKSKSNRKQGNTCPWHDATTIKEKLFDDKPQTVLLNVTSGRFVTLVSAKNDWHDLSLVPTGTKDVPKGELLNVSHSKVCVHVWASQKSQWSKNNVKEKSEKKRGRGRGRRRRTVVNKKKEKKKSNVEITFLWMLHQLAVDKKVFVAACDYLFSFDRPAYILRI